MHNLDAKGTLADSRIVIINALVVKNPPADAGDLRDVGWIPGSGRSPGEGNGNPLQYSCLENPMDRGVWQAIVRGVTRVAHDLVTKRPPSLDL